MSVTSNGQVFFTTDGSPAISGDLPSDNATLLTGNTIPITGLTDLSIATFDQVGNHVEGGGVYTPLTVAQAAAPTGLTAGAQTQTSVPLSWDASPASESVTGYQVTLYNAAGTKLTTQPPVTTLPRQTVTGLTPGTTYQFSVAAKNAAGAGPDSAKITKTTDVSTDRITITSAKWKVNDSPDRGHRLAGRPDGPGLHGQGGRHHRHPDRRGGRLGCHRRSSGHR